MKIPFPGFIPFSLKYELENQRRLQDERAQDARYVAEYNAAMGTDFHTVEQCWKHQQNIRGSLGK